ncbi:MAG: GspE/PulE family protein [Holosporales bacterium]|nr:GspE/PulE family protein [Holosporales bacterium]
MRDLLVSWGVLDSSQVRVVLKEQMRTGLLFADTAFALHLIDGQTLLSALGCIYDMDVVDLENALFDASCASYLPRAFACTNVALVMDLRTEHSRRIAKIAISDPGDINVRDRIFHALGPDFQVELVIALRHQILSFYSSQEETALKENETEIRQQTYELLQEAITCRASDIHFEPEDSLVRLRLRIDGELSTFKTLHNAEWQYICGYLKVLANLNITEHRKPQSGHARIRANGRWVDLRLSTHPSLFGEALVIRVLDAEAGLIPLTELGFSSDVLHALDKIVSTPHGIFLVAGPTGSGKTTTLYALLHALNPHERNIMTLEDPVEYQVSGARQLDLREEGLLSFADGIRSVLRQDPDVILVGEIRDEQTAFMALRAALTGRLVLATVHAHDVFSTFDRLQDLGLPPREILPHLVGVMSQRLVRKNPLYRKTNTSAFNRCAIAEILYFDQETRAALLTEEDHRAWRAAAHQHGFIPFMKYAQEAVAEGVTTHAEILRVFGSNEEKRHAAVFL